MKAEKQVNTAQRRCSPIVQPPKSYEALAVINEAFVQLTLRQFLERQQTRKLSRQFLEMVVDLRGLRQTTTAAFEVLDEP